MDRPGRTMLHTGHRVRRAKSVINATFDLFVLQRSPYPEVRLRAMTLQSFLLRETASIRQLERDHVSTYETASGTDAAAMKAAAKALGVKLRAEADEDEQLERIAFPEAEKLTRSYRLVRAQARRRARGGAGAAPGGAAPATPSAR